ncbi:hypothetical protein TNCV_628031 [Trichonephila clavipes]|nr:hypothetical protein TNCV_628031 [Trichonephila clavipes]
MLADELQPVNPPPIYRNFGALLDEWCNIPQDQIDNLILSMPRRCGTAIKGGERVKTEGRWQKSTKGRSERTSRNERDSDYVGEDRNKIVLTT